MFFFYVLKGSLKDMICKDVIMLIIHKWFIVINMWIS